RPHDEAPAPLRDRVAGVDRRAAGRHRFLPREERRRHPRTALASVDVLPPEVVACARDVDLVVAVAKALAARAVIRDRERLRIEPVEALHVANAAHVRRLPGPGVARRRRAIERHAEHLAAEVPDLLRPLRLRAVAGPDVEHLVGTDTQAPAVVPR